MLVYVIKVPTEDDKGMKASNVTSCGQSIA